MLEQRVCSVIGPKRCAHGGNRNLARLTIILNKGDRFMPHVGVELRLHPAPMKWMRALIVKPSGIHRVNAEKLQASSINQRRQAFDQTLSLKLPLIAGARGESKQRRSP